jgi:TonB family protein
MRHGIDGYFREVERFQRRLSAIGAGVSVMCLLAMQVLRQPAFVSALDDPKRFGFEGPDQYVERILLEVQGPVDQPGATTVNLVPASLQEGGGEKPAAREGTKPAPEVPRHGKGPGQDEFTLEARLRALALVGPVVQSQDLVVENLVRPVYPEEAREKDIEGLVELVALVDTTGRVVQVEIIGGTHQPLLEHAATAAVLQCRYRPYRVAENLERVWAYFRIHFSLY